MILVAVYINVQIGGIQISDSLLRSVVCLSTFCLSDKKGCVPVTVYNMVQGAGVKIGDSVAIPEPYGQVVHVKHKDKVSSLAKNQKCWECDMAILLSYFGPEVIVIEKWMFCLFIFIAANVCLQSNPKETKIFLYIETYCYNVNSFKA